MPIHTVDIVKYGVLDCLLVDTGHSKDIKITTGTGEQEQMTDIVQYNGQRSERSKCTNSLYTQAFARKQRQGNRLPYSTIVIEWLQTQRCQQQE